MENLVELEQIIKQYAPQAVQYVLMALGGLVVAGYSYIKATPNQDDDQWLQKQESKPIIGHLLRLLVRFSPVLRKEEPPKEESKGA